MPGLFLVSFRGITGCIHLGKKKILAGLFSTALDISARNVLEHFRYFEKTSGQFDGLYYKIKQRNKR